MCQQKKCLILVALFSSLHVLVGTAAVAFRPDPAPSRTRRDSKSSGYSGDDSDHREKSPRSENTSAVGKRCVRCDSGYDSYPYERRPYYGEGYEDGARVYDRYDDRYLDRDRYHDRDRYDRYSDRSRGRYGGQDRYGSQDRYQGGPSRYGNQDRYGGLDGYGSPDRYEERYRDRVHDRYHDYDRYDPYERYDKYNRFSDRGVGYDNRGYDYKGAESGGYRPWDETYRGTSGFDNAGRGYYFATGRPDYGSGNAGGYASGWNYGSSGSGSGRDDYYRDRGYGGYATYRPYRDPYDGYRVTSYLYGRPSSTTIKTPSAGEDDTNTPSPQENSG